MTPTAPTLQQAVLEFRRFLSIVHHVTGRVRLRLDPRALDVWPHGSRSALGFPFERLEGIRGVRVNAAALSVAIEYDPRVISPTLWDTLVRGDDDQVVALVDHFHDRWRESIAARRQEQKVSEGAA